MSGAAAGPVPRWQAYADAVLTREVVLWRTLAQVPPRDLAGCVVTDTDVDRLLRFLPTTASARVGTGVRESGTARPATDELLAAELASDSRLALVARRLGLDRQQVAALAVLAAVELDYGRQQVVAYLNDDVRRPRPTLGLLARMGLLEGVSPDSPVVQAGLVAVGAGEPWASCQVEAAPRLCWHLLGSDAPDPALDVEAEFVAGTQAPAQRTAPLEIVVGADRRSRRAAAQRALSGAALVVTPAGASDDAVRAAVREAALTGAGVLVESIGSLPAGLRRWMERSPVRWALSSPTEIALAELPRRQWHETTLVRGQASPDEWRTTIGATPAAGHVLDREQLHWVGVALRGGPAQSADDGSLPPSDAAVTAGVRRLASGVLDRLARRTEPTHGWDDLVLPPDPKAQLRELAARHRHRRQVHDDWGFGDRGVAGTVALFAGPSGTGKTMAAEVIAGELGLDLYRVDLASIVSKYIGETEKNLDKVFDAARAAAAVLLFDEADALFGKRTEVSDAHDRYANIEVSYLLQRLETHDGCVVLTTNLKRNIDEAFVRRLGATVDFPMPGPELRRALWSGNLPGQAPTGPLDLEFLADRFDVTGGMIRNAAVSAAFLAASDGTVIEMRHLVRAIRREMQKAGRLQTELDFGPYASVDALGEEADHAQSVG